MLSISNTAAVQSEDVKVRVAQSRAGGLPVEQAAAGIAAQGQQLVPDEFTGKGGQDWWTAH
jgi:hypothetical protein